MPLAANVTPFAKLFDGNIAANAVSEGARREEYRLNTIYAGYDNDVAEVVQVTLEVCGRQPTREADWVTLQAATNVPFHLVLPEGVYYAIRAKRNNTTRPITVVINSAGHTRL